MKTLSDRRGNTAGGIALLGALALLLGSLLARALTRPTGETVVGMQEPQYLQRFEGALSARPQSGGSGESTGGGEAGRAPGNTSQGSGEEGARTAKSTVFIESSPGSQKSWVDAWKPPAGFAAAPTPAPVTTDEGRALVSVMQDPRVLVKALSEADGSYVFVRGAGWKKLVGTEWVPVEPGSLPAGLRARHPLEVRAGGNPGDEEELSAEEESRPLPDPKIEFIPTPELSS